jgi:lipoate-protein ligase A
MMQLLELTCETPEENLALDEALLDQAEASRGPSEILRLWEMPVPCVVVGRSSRVAVEVNEAACRAAGVPVLRRCSGGAAVVAGPGCLMYSVVLGYRRHPELRALDRAHGYVLGVLSRAVSRLVSDVQRAGTSDLVRGERKFSGNSLRCRRDHLLYHGTVLYDFPLPLISRCLRHPPRQPDYRRQREHAAFVDNVPVSKEALITSLREAWETAAAIQFWPRAQVAELVASRYSQAAWNWRL